MARGWETFPRVGEIINTVTIPDDLFHQLKERARSQGVTVDTEAVQLLSQALARDDEEARLLAEIEKDREEWTQQGVFLTEESLREAKQ